MMAGPGSAAAAAAFASYDVEACRARIRARNGELNAVLRVLEPGADRANGAVAGAGTGAGPLAGVPYVLKDTWDTAGIVTTGGSWRHRARVPEVSSHAHRALAATGAVLLGKSNLCDLAFSTESDNHLLGPVRHPRDPSRTAGGSTGGGAAAVADGMAAFDWGTDFGGSIRGPAAFCGIVGMRLSASVWPVGGEHFPRIAPALQDMCGMGPLTRTVAGARAVTRAVRSALRTDAPEWQADHRRVVLYPPDRAHDGEWPTFVSDVAALLRRVGSGFELAAPGAGLPPPSAVNALYTRYLAAHVRELISGDELPIREGLPAVLVGLASGGRLDKRVHPNTGILLAAVVAIGAAMNERGRAAARADAASLREDLSRIWAGGRLVVTPACTERPPRHGRAALATRIMSFCKLGNLTDATGLALPFGAYPARRGGRSPAMPRSLQILGPPGSEEAVLDLAERLEAAIGAAASG
jgi:Asp-tRNA(Asn)/Glu-tRNA(Gln) amidotransferase A subunit family amidase